MEHSRQEIRVEAPVEHVWKSYCDTSHWEDWMPRGKFSELGGPVDKVGTTYVGAMKIMGFEMKATTKVKEVEPLRLIHEHSDYGPEDNYIRAEPDGPSRHGARPALGRASWAPCRARGRM